MSFSSLEKDQCSKPLALVVDDDVSIRLTLATLLVGLGFQVNEAASTEEAIVRLGASVPAICLLVTDYEMPGASGVTLIREMIASKRGEMPTVVLFTAHDLALQEIAQLRAEVQGRYPVYFVTKNSPADWLCEYFEKLAISLSATSC